MLMIISLRHRKLNLLMVYEVRRTGKLMVYKDVMTTVRSRLTEAISEGATLPNQLATRREFTNFAQGSASPGGVYY